jgi:hypothetical protein
MKQNTRGLVGAAVLCAAMGIASPEAFSKSKPKPEPLIECSQLTKLDLSGPVRRRVLNRSVDIAKTLGASSSEIVHVNVSVVVNKNGDVNVSDAIAESSAGKADVTSLLNLSGIRIPAQAQSCVSTVKTFLYPRD